jgi:hypothetical protein
MLRVLTEDESRLILRLLEEDFPGRDAIRLQIDSSHVKDWDDHNGSLEFDVGPSPLAITKSVFPWKESLKTSTELQSMYFCTWLTDALRIWKFSRMTLQR